MREAAGLVTVLTADDLRRAGCRNLLDALRLLPTFEFGTDIWNSVGLAVRGNWAFESKVLVLIDSHEWNEIALTRAWETAHAKLQVGRAFRAPGFQQSQYGGVRPEHSTTLEAELGFGPTRWAYVVGSAYEVRMTDALAYVVSHDGTESYTNLGRTGTRGGEVTVEVRVNPVSVTAGYAGYTGAGLTDPATSTGSPATRGPTSGWRPTKASGPRSTSRRRCRSGRSGPCSGPAGRSPGSSATPSRCGRSSRRPCSSICPRTCRRSVGRRSG